jgi:hypothetical protein
MNRQKTCFTCKYGDWSEPSAHCSGTDKRPACKMWSNWKPAEKRREIKPIYIGHRDNG